MHETYKIKKVENMKNTENEEQGIFQYIRRRHHGRMHKVGVILAKPDHQGIIRVGFSKCNIKHDRFDPDLGLEIAHKRIDGILDSPPVPDCIRRQIREMGCRAIRYYRNSKLVELPV